MLNGIKTFNMKHDADYWIQSLNMKPHPEGGYFTETYRSQNTLDQHCLPKSISGERNFATSIFFLLQQGDVSAFHRLQSDENWYFHDGSGIVIYRIDAEGKLIKQKLGLDLKNGFVPHVTIPGGSWFAAEPVGKGFALVSCVVSPGFDIKDFELAETAELTDAFPQHKELIERLCIS